MAYLLNKHTITRCYLHAYHSFGRFPYSVDTLVSNPSVSKIHAIIEWHDQRWTLRDISSNGTWVNNVKLAKEQEYILQLGDSIRFIGDQIHGFIVQDLSAPSDMLVPSGSIIQSANHDSQLDAIKLSNYHLLPSEQAPEVALIFNQNNEQWRLEYINSPDQDSRLLHENDFIELNNVRWQLKLSHLEKDTEIQHHKQHTINDLSFIFDLSLNEESTKLQIKTPQKITNLQTRAHHYVTLNLARYRVADAQKGISPENQGWVNTERLIKDLGVDMSHLNIQIHRTRKQFSESFTNINGIEDIIERQLRQVRFAGTMIEIYKGHQLESTLSNHTMMEC
ncbi:MAG: hypothetical protein ACI9LM_004690 [Alteromonadaceae bacterium]|jgi:hypothetical protein